MTPARLDHDTVLRRLRLIEASLSDLAGLRGATEVTLRAEPIPTASTRPAASRLRIGQARDRSFGGTSPSPR